MATGIGDALQSARLEQGSTLDDAARATRIRYEYLAALEDEAFTVIGGDVYAKGFLTSYARYLGIDPDPLVETYRREVQHEYSTRDLVELPTAVRTRRTLPGWLVWGAAVGVLLLAGLALAGTLGGRTPSPALAPTREPSPAATSRSPRPSPSPRPPSPSPSPSPTPSGINLVILVEENCWLDVRADGQPAAPARTYRPGEAVTVTAVNEVAMRFGNAGGVRLEFNGQALGAPGGRGEVLDGLCTPQGCQFG